MTNKPTRKRSTGRVTLHDVALQAGVSAVTVSRALRGTRRVDPDVVARVTAVATRMGYVPDPVARALVSSRSSNVAVLVPLLTNAVFVEVLEAIQVTLWPQGYQTVFGVTHYDAAEEERLLQGYLLHRPAGLIVTGFDRTETSRRLLESSGVPCVHLMETSGAAGIYSVGFSQRDAGQAMTEHLLQRGRRRIMFVAAQLDARTMQRAEGYRRSMRDAGLYDPKLELLTPERSSMALGARLFAEARRKVRDVDALFMCNDDLAHGALMAALRKGVKVPEDVAIAGFNDLPGSDQLVPRLTTVRTPRGEIGFAAAKMLLDLMQGRTIESPALDLGFTLMTREST